MQREEKEMGEKREKLKVSVLLVTDHTASYAKGFRYPE